MRKIKKGDIVARKSHDCDILFSVEDIIRSSNNLEIAILKGITIRIVADAYISDLITFDSRKADDIIENLDIRIENRVNDLLRKRIEYKDRNTLKVMSRQDITFRWSKLYYRK